MHWPTSWPVALERLAGLPGPIGPACCALHPKVEPVSTMSDSLKARETLAGRSEKESLNLRLDQTSGSTADEQNCFFSHSTLITTIDDVVALPIELGNDALCIDEASAKDERQTSLGQQNASRSNVSRYGGPTSGPSSTGLSQKVQHSMYAEYDRSLHVKAPA
jgi:hypothetical protein